MTRELAALFPHPLPCVALEEWTGLKGWPVYRVTVMQEGAEQSGDFKEYANHREALFAAADLASSLNLPIIDLTEEAL